MIPAAVVPMHRVRPAALESPLDRFTRRMLEVNPRPGEADALHFARQRCAFARALNAELRYLAGVDAELDALREQVRRMRSEAARARGRCEALLRGLG